MHLVNFWLILYKEQFRFVYKDDIYTRRYFIISRFFPDKKIKKYYSPHVSGGAKKVAQLLKGRNFKNTNKSSTKLHTTFFQHSFNHSNRIEVFWYEVPCGYAALIQIYDLLKVVPFFWTTRYTLHMYKASQME